MLVVWPLLGRDSGSILFGAIRRGQVIHLVINSYAYGNVWKNSTHIQLISEQWPAIDRKPWVLQRNRAYEATFD